MQGKKVSAYRTNVIDVNKALKIEMSSVGACRSMLLEHGVKIGLTSEFATYLKASKKDEALYKELDGATRRSKSGKVSPFFVLQALYSIHKNKAEALKKAGKVAKVETSNK